MSVREREEKGWANGVTTDSVLKNFNSTIKKVERSLKQEPTLSRVNTERLKNVQRRMRDLEFTSSSHGFQLPNQYMNYMFPEPQSRSDIRQYKSKMGLRIFSPKSESGEMFLEGKYQRRYRPAPLSGKQRGIGYSNGDRERIAQLGIQNSKLRSENKLLKRKLLSYDLKKGEEGQEYQGEREVPEEGSWQGSKEENSYRQLSDELKKRVKEEIEHFKSRIEQRESNTQKGDQVPCLCQDDADSLWEQFLRTDSAKTEEGEQTKDKKENTYDQIILSRPKYMSPSGASTQRSRPIASLSAYPLTSRNR